MTLNLWGAYHLEGRPLDQRRLAVFVELGRSALGGLPSGRLRAVVDAEGLAERAPAEVRVRWHGFRAEYRVTFDGEDAARYTLELVQGGGSAVRALSEIVGTLANDARTVRGAACLRLDYRALY